MGFEPTLELATLPDGPLSFETIVQGFDSGYTKGEDPQELKEPTLFVISDNQTWNVFWARHNESSSDPPSAPSIEFSKHTVLAVMDHRHGSITSLEIVDVDTSAGALTVHVKRTCMPWLQPAWPFHIVRIDRHGWRSAVLERTDVNGGNPCRD
jgi:hypothetical protein